MTLDEIKIIRERKSLETKGMTTEEAAAYFKKGADNIKKIMDELKQERANAKKNTDKVAINQ